MIIRINKFINYIFELFAKINFLINRYNNLTKKMY